ncbi:MAG: DUF1367 family protein [Janthinobacterium lividum]
MTDIILMKTPGGALVPADAQAAEYIAKLKLGVGVRAKVVRVNNPAFHRKMFALFNIAFDAWEPGEKEYKGVKVEKEFDRFRKDVTIMAGFYETSIDLRGEVRLAAKSLNFASMEQEERERVYSAVINVVLGKILTNYTREDLDAVVDRVLEFA